MRASSKKRLAPGALPEFHQRLREEAQERERAGLQRSLSLPEGVDFVSNDYLGLSRHPALRDAMRRGLERPPYGAPASRLLRGTSEHHLALENRLAEFKGTDAALFFSTGYAANLGALGSLIRKEDRALSDQLNHASIIDGLRLSGCRREIYPHLDLDSLEKHLRSPHHRGRTFVVTETLFSMDGDRAPLDRIAGLAEKYSALLILDDAHATGLYGPVRGSGLVEEFGVERRALAIVSTCGKGMGLFGAFVGGEAPVMDCLVNRARTFIFSTAPPPVLLAGVEAAVNLIQNEPDRRQRLHQNSAHLRDALKKQGIDGIGGCGPIVPVLLGGNERSLAVAEFLRQRGFDVRAIRPPTVPEGTARLRISVHADHLPEELDGLAEALAQALRKHPDPEAR